jgi:hypothetical protein
MKFCYIVLISCMSLNARDPFFLEESKTLTRAKKYVLKGTILADIACAHVEYDGHGCIVIVNDTVGDFVVKEIEMGRVVLSNGKKYKVLEIE